MHWETQSFLAEERRQHLLREANARHTLRTLPALTLRLRIARALRTLSEHLEGPEIQPQRATAGLC